MLDIFRLSLSLFFLFFFLSFSFFSFFFFFKFPNMIIKENNKEKNKINMTRFSLSPKIGYSFHGKCTLSRPF